MTKSNLFNSKNLGVALLVGLALIYAPIPVSFSKPIGVVIVLAVAMYMILK